MAWRRVSHGVPCVPHTGFIAPELFELVVDREGRVLHPANAVEGKGGHRVPFPKTEALDMDGSTGEVRERLISPSLRSETSPLFLLAVDDAAQGIRPFSTLSALERSELASGRSSVSTLILWGGRPSPEDHPAVPPSPAAAPLPNAPNPQEGGAGTAPRRLSADGEREATCRSRPVERSSEDVPARVRSTRGRWRKG